MLPSLLPAIVPEPGSAVGRHVIGMSGGHYDSDSLGIPLLWTDPAKEESFPAASSGIPGEGIIVS